MTHDEFSKRRRSDGRGAPFSVKLRLLQARRRTSRVVYLVVAVLATSITTQCLMPWLFGSGY